MEKEKLSVEKNVLFGAVSQFLKQAVAKKKTEQQEKREVLDSIMEDPDKQARPIPIMSDNKSLLNKDED